MPSSRKATKVILQMVPVKAHVIYELGSGWGTLALALGKQFPDATIYAYEISPFPWFISLILKKILDRKNIQFLRKNFFQVSLNKADVVVCYLYPGAMEKLKKKFFSELKNGSYIISNSFAIQSYKPFQEKEVGDIWNSKVFLYQTST